MLTEFDGKSCVYSAIVNIHNNNYPRGIFCPCKIGKLYCKLSDISQVMLIIVLHDPNSTLSD